MGRPQSPQRPFISLANPFRMMFPKGSDISPKLLNLSTTFEATLSTRLKNLKPANNEDVLRLSWMRFAMESLCGIHGDIKTLITSLELPISDWDDKWIDVYLDNSIKLLDICNSFTSEISRLKQGHLFLQLVLHNLTSSSSDQFTRARSSMDRWRDLIGSKNPRLDNCFPVMDSLAQTLNLPKIKNSPKGKVLMRAMYGVKVVTLYMCSVFAAAFSGDSKKLMDLEIPETCLWAEAFGDLQISINTEMRNMCSTKRVIVVKEMEDVDRCVKKLYSIVAQNGVDCVQTEDVKNATLDLEKSAGKLSERLDMVAKEVDGFFHVVLTGRDALLCNLRIDGSYGSNEVVVNRNVGQTVR